MTEKRFRDSKKAISAVLGAATLIILGALHAHPYYAVAAAAIFGGHQVAQGAQDAVEKWRGQGVPMPPLPMRD